MPMLDLFQPGPIQVEVAKQIMVSFNRSQTETLTDLLVVNGVMYIAKILHDSIDASTFDDEKRQISELILHFVRRVRRWPLARDAPRLLAGLCRSQRWRTTASVRVRARARIGRSTMAETLSSSSTFSCKRGRRSQISTASSRPSCRPLVR